MSSRTMSEIDSSDRVRSNERGFTLIELLIGLAISAILVGMIYQIARFAQDSYDRTTRKVEVAQKVRYAMDDLQLHIERMQPVADLEFFVDRQNTGGGLQAEDYWDQGEEIRGEYAFANLGGGLPDEFDQAAHIVERFYSQQVDFGNAPRHANFSLYFRGTAEIGNSIRAANIEYYLCDPAELARAQEQGENTLARVEGEIENPRRLALAKRVSWIDIDEESFDRSVVPVRSKVTIVCENVSDLQFEYWYDNYSDSASGAWVVPSIENEDGRRSEYPVTTLDNGVMKKFLYGGFQATDRATIARGIRRSGDTGAAAATYEPAFFRSAEQQQYFSELNVGDTIYLWKDALSQNFSEDDARTYRIAARQNDRLFFERDLDTALWRGDEGAIRFRAGFIPQAIRVTLTVWDRAGQYPRDATMVVRPISKRR